MTKRKRKALKREAKKSKRLKRLRRRGVEYDFEGGTLTSDSGLLLLREIDQRLNLTTQIDQAIPDPRDPRYIVHSQRDMLVARIYGIAAGYEDGNDHQDLRNDVAFQVAADKTPDTEDAALASPSTLSRLENRVAAKTIFELHNIFVQTFLNSYQEPPKEIILDIDATDDRVHGNQENKAFNGFYNGYCFLPLYVFCGDHLLASYLRPCNIDGAKHSAAICKLLVEKIRKRWPDTRVVLRGDSGFRRERLMSWCERHDVGYVFGMQKNSTLEKLLATEMEAAKKEFEETQERVQRFVWLHYGAQKWRRKRRLVGKAEHTAKGSNPRFVVTNLFDGCLPADVACCPVCCPQAFYKQRYCPRGEMENRIKEQQNYLFADRTSCTDFMANQFRLMLSSFAYVLMDGLRRLGLKETKGERWRVDTIRLKLIKIASRVRKVARRVVFHLASNCPNQMIFEQVMKNLTEPVNAGVG